MDCLIFVLHAGLNCPALTLREKQYRLYYKKKRYVHFHLCGAWKFLLVTVLAAQTFTEWSKTCSIHKIHVFQL